MGWLEIAQWRLIGEGIEDIVVLTLISHRDCPCEEQVFCSYSPIYLNIDQVPLLQAVERVLVLLWIEALLVMRWIKDQTWVARRRTRILSPNV